MRSATLLLLVLSACNTQIVGAPESGPESVRERLVESDTRLLLSASESAGTLTAQRNVGGGTWEAGLVDLKVDQGELVASADATGTITIERFSLVLAPIQIPEQVFGRPAALSHVRAELLAPAEVETAWSDDDAAHATAALALKFSWALTIDGGTAELGSPNLPPLTVELDLAGDGSFVHADVHASGHGELWSWAGLIKLEDLSLVVAAETR